jgi:hypothetical protein
VIFTIHTRYCNQNQVYTIPRCVLFLVFVLFLLFPRLDYFFGLIFQFCWSSDKNLILNCFRMYIIKCTLNNISKYPWLVKFLIYWIIIIFVLLCFCIISVSLSCLEMVEIVSWTFYCADVPLNINQSISKLIGGK